MRSASASWVQAGWSPLADLQFAVACVLVVVFLALLLAARAPVFSALILVLPAAAALGGASSCALSCGSHVGARVTSVVRPPCRARLVLGSASAACDEREVDRPPCLARSFLGFASAATQREVCWPPRLALPVLVSASAACDEREVCRPPRLARSALASASAARAARSAVLCLRCEREREVWPPLRARARGVALACCAREGPSVAKCPGWSLRDHCLGRYNLTGEAGRSSARHGRVRVGRACVVWFRCSIRLLSTDSNK